MSGETNLKLIVKQMRPVLKKEEYAFCSIPHGSMDWSHLEPLGSFCEDEGITLILEKEKAQKNGLKFEFPCRKITLSVHSSLEAVGLLAMVTQKLATAGISVNALSAFYHDHLFVPLEKAEEAVDLLNALAESEWAHDSFESQD